MAKVPLSELIKGHEVTGCGINAMTVTFDGELAGIALELPGEPKKCLALCGADLIKSEKDFHDLVQATGEILVQHYATLEVNKQMAEIAARHPNGITIQQLAKELLGEEVQVSG